MKSNSLDRSEQIIFKIVPIVIILLFVISIIFFLNRNSLDALPRGDGSSLVIEGKRSHLGSRIVQQYTIINSNLGRIELAVSFPNPIPKQPLPVLFILGGVETGFNSVHYVSDIGNNILVGYDWPINPKLPKGINILTEFSSIYSNIYKTPGQIAEAIEWVWREPWTNKEKISLLGFSMGAIASPAVQRIIEDKGIAKIGWTVIAYGGANIGRLLNSNQNIRPNWIKPFIGWIMQILFNPLDPKEHLSYISGKFLLINGKDDEFIPKESSLLIQKLTPSPKTIILLDGRHMGVGEKQKELLSIIIQKTRSWLEQQGAIDFEL